ncbi:MAG: DUF2330 domain-containing protein [Deltaproteobacteria bacterium]|nr:DUF2330 domain-containing protein [Deltaproteobacteria bacterium]
MRRAVMAICLPAAIAALAGIARADRGSIPFKPHVQIFEPNQRAMIAWNGAREILLLSTDLRASAPTKVLEVLPLPAEPEVKKGDVEVFRRATELINRKIAQPHLAEARTRGMTKSAAQVPAGEVTFHKKIGAHDVSVTHVLDAAGFVSWVEAYLKKSGVGTPEIPPALKAVVEEYLSERFTWFVFDVVELDEQPKTNEAIEYSFATDRLYYPLKITRTESGFTTVDLLVLTPRLLRNFPGIPASRVQLAHEPVSISRRELESLSRPMAELLGRQAEYKLRIWKVSGRLRDFTADLIAY